MAWDERYYPPSFFENQRESLAGWVLCRLYYKPVRMPWKRLPLIGKQFSEPGDGVTHDTAEHVIEILPRVNTAGFAGLYQPKVERGGTGASVACRKEPILSA